MAMKHVSRRNALTVSAAAGAAVLAGSLPAPAAEADEAAGYNFAKAPHAESCRLLARTIAGFQAQARVVPGFVTNTFILIVWGKKPYLNMKVTLAPRVYVQQPDYWGIEVVGCVPGIALPAVGLYNESLPLDGIQGKKGIEVFWAGESLKIDKGDFKHAAGKIKVLIK
jgi:hypothetical protein